MLKTYKQLRDAGLMPFSKTHLRRLIRDGKYEPPVKFGGAKSRNHFDDDYARRRIIELKMRGAQS
jgi:hypothetical protein